MADFHDRKSKAPKTGELSGDELNKVTAGSDISYDVSRAVELYCSHCKKETTFLVLVSGAKYCSVCNNEFE